jgi:hypothetical protein
MSDPAEQLGPGSRTLELWANLYRRGAFRAPLPSGAWQAADDLIRVAKQADSSASGDLAKALDLSNRTFDPLADPLATDFGAHRWLSSEREEAYSDWFGWILEQIGDAGRVLRLLGVRDRKLLRVCASDEPLINREFKIPEGRPDLVVEFGKHLLVIVEIKTKSFDPVAVGDQLARYARWFPDRRNKPDRTLRYFAAVEFGELDCLSTFEPLPWRELTLRMREQAREWIRASKNQPVDRSDLVRAAMTLAFCGAVEQNLLGLSGKPVIFRTRSSAEYLEEWSAKT